MKSDVFTAIAALTTLYRYENDFLFPAATYPPKYQTLVKVRGLLGRNAKCPCGSGKKVKHCCNEQVKYKITPAGLDGDPVEAPADAGKEKE
jgi:hypothetical protein